MCNTKWNTELSVICRTVPSIKWNWYTLMSMKSGIRMVVLNIIVLQVSVFKLKYTIIRETILNFDLPDYASSVIDNTQRIERQALDELRFNPVVIVPVISSNKTEREQGSLLSDCTDFQLLFLLLKKQAENR